MQSGEPLNEAEMVDFYDEQDHTTAKYRKEVRHVRVRAWAGEGRGRGGWERRAALLLLAGLANRS